MQTFLNPSLAWEEIPRHQSVELSKVTPAYKTIMMIERVIIWLVIAAFVTTALLFSSLADKQWWMLAGGVLLVTLLGMLIFTAKKAFDNMGYALRKHDLVFRKGWLFEKMHIIPLKKIQHCQVKRGPLERRYGLASLKIFTAGGSGADITLGGLTQQEAARLKDWLVITPGEPVNPTSEENADSLG